MDLTCIRMGEHAVPIAPARAARDIFDANRHAYRCLPLTIANTAGWELLCPTGVTIEWNGGPLIEDLTVTPDDPIPFASSHFATGIVTFEVGWLFRTSPGVDLWAMGPTNDPKDGIAPLTGLIETDWLPYTFTMNWKMTRPGAVRFEKGEPFCFITPGNIAAVKDCRPLIREAMGSIGATQDVWRAERDAFMERFNAGDPTALKHPWGQRYFKGEQTPGSSEPNPERHFQKLRAKTPVEADFLIIDGFVDAATCDALADAWNVGDYETNADHEFWSGRMLGVDGMSPETFGLALECMHEATAHVEAFYGVSGLHADVLHLGGWYPGQEMPAHSDNAYEDGSPHALAHRAFSGVLYLNDGYEGGELYLPAQDIKIAPRKGMFISLPGGLSHQHAVLRVEQGIRITMPFFLTFDAARSDPRLAR